MDIIHFTHSFLPLLGGTTTRNYHLLLGSNNNYQLVTQYPSLKDIPEENRALDKVEQFVNINILRVDIPNNFFTKIPLFGIIYKAYIISKRTKDIDFEFVHGHNPIEFALAAFFFSKRNSLPLIYEIHRIYYDSQINYNSGKIVEIRNSLRNRFFKRIEQIIINRAKVIIVQTEGMKNRICELFKIKNQQFEILPMGIEGEIFKQKFLKEETRNRYGIHDGRLFFLYNGFLAEDTGILFFVKTLLSLPKKYLSKVKLIILGRGELKPQIIELENKYPDIFKFFGVIQYEKMPEIYEMCDISILPYPNLKCWQTNLPTKLLEAVAMRKVILASKVKGISCLLDSFKGNILYEPENQAELLSALIYLIENFSEINDFDNSARDFVLKNYDWSNIKQNLEKIYTELKESLNG